MQVKHMGSCLSPFLNTGYIFACFQSNGIEPKKEILLKKMMVGNNCSYTFLEDSTMYFIRTSGLIGVVVTQSFSTPLT